MSRSSARGQVEPTAALVVLFAVAAAVSTYAVALEDTVQSTDRTLAEPTLDRVVQRLSVGGVVEPARTRRAHGVKPAGYRLNLTVAAAGRRWSVGPVAPRGPEVDRASASVGVRLAPGRIRPGRVHVEVWS
jgi:hypothetical protein